MQQKVKVFVSYAHEDDKLREQLDRHLSQLKRKNFIDVWHDRDISPGRDWKQEIDAQLNDAQIILLLVSADFLASEYCSGIEMERALQKHREGSARVIPVILRPVDWGDAPFNNLQTLPLNGEPVTTWPSGPDSAFFNITRGIRKAIKEILAMQWYQAGDTLCNGKHYKEALDALEQALKETLDALEQPSKLDSSEY
jgi:TIR domain